MSIFKQIKKLVSTIELELDLDRVALEDWRALRLEIFEGDRPGIYFGRIFRQEFFRIQPTFPQSPSGQPSDGACDEVLWIADEAIFSYEETFKASDLAQAEAVIIGRIERWLQSFMDPGNP